MIGHTNVIGMCETIMENIALTMGKPALEIRLANMDQDENKKLIELINEHRQHSDYDNRLKAVEEFNKVRLPIVIILVNKLMLFITNKLTDKPLDEKGFISCSHDFSIFVCRRFKFNCSYICRRWKCLSIPRWN